VRSLSGVAEDSDKSTRALALEQIISDAIVKPDKGAFLNDLLDLPQPPEITSIYDAMDAQARREGKRTALVELVSELAARNAIFIVVEDLHWADSITLDYLACLANTVAECPALMVFTSRAEGDPIDTNWRALAGQPPIVTWDLSPLRNNESAELVSVLLDVSESLAQRCIERAAGNPLFLEQLLLSIKNDAIESVPGSIKSLMLSRMDNLPEEDKHALQTASVLGQRFDPGCLCFMINDRAFNYQNLIDHHLLRPEGTQYLFAHALIREAAYTSLIKRQRLDLHRKAAQWYAQRDPGLYAEHLDYAEDPGASSAYLAAARDQARHYRLERALQLIKRGLKIPPETEQFDLHHLQGGVARFDRLISGINRRLSQSGAIDRRQHNALPRIARAGSGPGHYRGGN
jgi:predicted ATPase